MLLTIRKQGENMNKLSYFREKNELTQRELAKKLQVSNATIAMWETAQRNPTLGKARQLSQIFNVSIEEIFFKNNDNEMLAK